MAFRVVNLVCNTRLAMQKDKINSKTSFFAVNIFAKNIVRFVTNC